jgi:hypothetical protein
MNARSAPPIAAAEPAAPAADLLALAAAYARAAEALFAAAGQAGAAASAPARFCAVQAMELYLDAYLRGAGESPCRLRGHRHNLGMRAALAMARGLPLRRKTALHLVALSRERAHAALRYGPARPASACELNRLVATLAELGLAVRAAAA